jgi:hypothetical protein
MSLPGRQWGHVELRCPPGPFRVFGEFPQASGGLYDDPTYSDDDGSHCKNNGSVTFRACPGIEASKTGTAQ